MSITNVFQVETVSSTSSDSSDPTLPHDDTIIESLGSYEFDVRLQTINGLSTIAKRDSQWFLKFLRKGELVKQLEILLDDERWEVQHQTLKFLHDALPTFGSNTEFCMSYLLSAIVLKLGSSKLTVRRITNHLLTVYLKINPNIISIVQKVLINYLTQPVVDADAQYTMLNEIPNLFIAECSDKNWQILSDGLHKLSESKNSRIVEKATGLQKQLEAFLRKEKPKPSKLLSGQLSLENDATPHETVAVKNDRNDPRKNTTSSSSCRRYRFRVIPEKLFNSLQQPNDSATKIAGLEQIKSIMTSVSVEDIRKIVPHLHSYFVTLGKVLEDPDENIKFNCLEIVKLSIQKFVGHLDDHVQHIISLVAKNFGTEKAMTRQLTMSICLKLMQNTNGKVVVSGLCPYTENKNPRIKEEVINVLIAAFLNFDASELNSKAVAEVIIPLLTDEQRRVRLAAFELFALIVNVDSAEVDDIMAMVRLAEVRCKSYGLSEAVSRRISRKVLPKMRFDGLIEYSTPFSLLTPLLFGNGSGIHENADYNWIKRGSNIPNTGFSRRLSPLPLRRNLSEERNLASWQAEDNLPSFTNSQCAEKNLTSSDDQILFASLDSGMGSSGSRAHSANTDASHDTARTATTEASSSIDNGLENIAEHHLSSFYAIPVQEKDSELSDQS